MKTSLTLLALVVFVGVSVPVLAQAPVGGSSDPESLFTSPDPKLHANKQVVMHIMRDLLEAGHWKDAPNFLTERYIQQKPAIPPGRESPPKATSSGLPSSATYLIRASRAPCTRRRGSTCGASRTARRTSTGTTAR